MSAGTQGWDNLTEAEKAAQRARIGEMVERFIAERDERARRAVNPLTGTGGPDKPADPPLAAAKDKPAGQRRDGG
jgi:hypothetical protein